MAFDDHIDVRIRFHVQRGTFLALRLLSLSLLVAPYSKLLSRWLGRSAGLVSRIGARFP